jgi:hypothetical protein
LIYLHKEETHQMVHVISILRSTPIPEQARLLGTLRDYVTNEEFVKILANYDLNDCRGDQHMHLQIDTFEYTSDLKAQVVAWLSSGTGESI